MSTLEATSSTTSMSTPSPTHNLPRHLFVLARISSSKFSILSTNSFNSPSLVRYFQCAPNRGLFTRLHRLSRYPLDENGNRVLDFDEQPPATLTRTTRRICSPSSSEGRVTTTFTRVTSASTTPAAIPHYALPARPAKVITTVTTTTTTTVQKPKSALKKTCRATSNHVGTAGARQQNHVHF